MFGSFDNDSLKLDKPASVNYKELYFNYYINIKLIIKSF